MLIYLKRRRFLHNRPNGDERFTLADSVEIRACVLLKNYEYVQQQTAGSSSAKFVYRYVC